MKVIILAAGQGTRLRPLTNDRPKCMVEIAGKPLLHWQLNTLEACGIKRADIAIVGGYLQHRLDAPGVIQYTNPKYDSTNMVSTLFCAVEHMKADEDLLICYGDIVYEPAVLNAVLSTKGEIVLGADLEWRKLWSMRMENPLSDAETFKFNDEGNVVELGKKPSSYDEIQAQYMGLIKVPASKVAAFIKAYNDLPKDGLFDGKGFDNMYMTSFIQHLIDNQWKAVPALVENGWVEIDSVEDHAIYNKIAVSHDNKTLYFHVSGAGV